MKSVLIIFIMIQFAEMIINDGTILAICLKK